MISRIIRYVKVFYYSKIKHKSLNEINIDEWRKAGITIGERCVICSSLPVGRDSCLLEFGDDDLISAGVTFLMHDAAPTTLSDDNGTDILGRVKIGNKCFIGARSIIMPGVYLADNTLIGAGSVVTHSITTPGLVLAGNPARVICTVEEYLSKNKNYIVNLDGMGLEEIKAFSVKHPDKIKQRK